jgi:hypothetical protein
VTDFTKVPASSIFNDVIAVKANNLVEQARKQFQEMDEVAAYDRSLSEEREQSAAASQQMDKDLFESIRRSRDQSFSSVENSPQYQSDEYDAPIDTSSVPSPSSLTPPKKSTLERGRTSESFDAASVVYDNEVRRDSKGNPTIYNPPSGDGGGAFEFAGITARYQPKEAARLRSLIDQGKVQEAEDEAKAFYRKRAEPYVKHSSDPGIQLQLTDTVHHRGEGGLRQILQRATGSNSKSYGELIQMLEKMPNAHDKFHQARRSYELEVVDRGRKSRKKFRPGLLNRFDKMHAMSINVSKRNGN